MVLVLLRKETGSATYEDFAAVFGNPAGPPVVKQWRCHCCYCCTTAATHASAAAAAPAPAPAHLLSSAALSDEASAMVASTLFVHHAG